ncbi:MAG: response regulator [Comamonas sp.]|nr:response regulator [Candidatus Comamonas equi]
MSRPDLSFLMTREEDMPSSSAAPPELEATGLGALPSWELPQALPSDDPLAALIAELRNYQTELEIQNKVLDYSQAVAESASERFEALFASVPLPLLVLDEHDMVIQANAMAHSAFQPEEQDRLLVSFMPFVCPSDTQRVSHAFVMARKMGHSEAQEVIFTLGSGEQMQGDLHIACIQIPQQDGPAIAQFMCAVVDQGPLLAERVALQERNAQLYASERRLESVINSSLDAIICVDKDQCITVFNPTAAALFLCPAADALGSKLDRFLPDAVHALGFAPLTTQAMLGEMTARTATGKTLPVEVGMSFERLSDVEITTVFARDLTSRKRAEAQRSELEIQLRESHKMQALGTMAGGIAHDFNNIVGAILGNVELAKADCSHNPQALESLLEIEKAGRRARDLVRQILTFSRNDPPKRYAVRAYEVMRHTERLLRVTLPPAIDLVVDIPAELPCMLADPTQVEQALFNLTTNAVHALGDTRGCIRMEATLSLSEQRVCERLGLTLGDYVVITVQDNGPGIPAETLQRIFEPFFTTKPVGQGTGLGLAVVHGVMRTHGGAVDVTSHIGVGSNFALYFPVSPDVLGQDSLSPPTPPALHACAVPAASAMPQPVERRHVMYVDDDQALVSLVRRLLRRRGYEVTGFLDPHQATQALQANPHAFDLLVTDYNMPGYCGVDLVLASKRIRPDLPVALASGYVTAEIEAQALAAGALALIHKPNDVDELCATVDRLIQSSPQNH